MSPSIEAVIDLRISGACIMSVNATFLNASSTLPAQLAAAAYRDFSSLNLFAKSSDPTILDARVSGASLQTPSTELISG
jgi:hypothetical protein